MIANIAKTKQPLKANWFHKRFFGRQTLFVGTILKKRQLKAHQGITQLDHVDNMALQYLNLYLQHNIIQKHKTFRPINRLKVNKTQVFNQQILHKQIEQIRGRQKPKIIEVEKGIFITQKTPPKLQDRFIAINKHLELSNTILQNKIHQLKSVDKPVKALKTQPKLQDRFVTINKNLLLSNTILK
ncbi:MAG: hypothetical protein JXQ76_11610, partial [Campylobacterales bacterium]|nr:hypothetical protein [Campylobacterales bacterium]